MKSVNKHRKSGGDASSRGAVSQHEVRVLSCGNDIAAEQSVTASQECGFVGAAGQPTSSTFVLKYFPSSDGGSFSRPACSICLCARNDRVVLEGKIIDIQPLETDPTILCFTVSVGHIFWLFLCDRNPRLEVKRLGLTNGIGFRPPIFVQRFELEGSQSQHVLPSLRQVTDSTAPRRQAAFRGPYQPALTVTRDDVRDVVGGNGHSSILRPASTAPPAPVARAVTPVPSAPLRPQPSPSAPPPAKPMFPMVPKVKVVVRAAPTPAPAPSLAPAALAKLSRELPTSAAVSQRSELILRLIKEAIASGEKRKVELKKIRVFAPSVDMPSFSGQPRTHFDVTEMQRLQDSIVAIGLLDPLLVIPVHGDSLITHELVDGERRLRALRNLTWSEADVVVIDIKHAELIKQAQHLVSLARNFCRQGHTPMENSRAICQQLDAGMSQTQLAGIIGRTAGYVSAVAGLQRLVPELQVLADYPTPEKERMRFAGATVLSRVDPAHQVRIWNEASALKHQRDILHRVRELSEDHLVVKKVRVRGAYRALRGVVKGAMASVSRLERLSQDRLRSMVRAADPESVLHTLGDIRALEEHLRNLRRSLEQVSAPA